MQILEQIEIARSKEVKRRNSRAQLLSTHPYSKKLEYKERELSKKHDADRKIAEKRIRDLLHKQQQLEKGCQSLSRWKRPQELKVSKTLTIKHPPSQQI